jgi:hypothetical protein
LEKSKSKIENPESNFLQSDFTLNQEIRDLKHQNIMAKENAKKM